MRQVSQRHPVLRQGGPELGRRGLLLAAAGASIAVTAGCSLRNPFETSRTPAVEAVEDLAPDVALAVTAVAALLEANARAQLLIAEFPAAGEAVTGLITLHTAHLKALTDAVPDSVDPAPQTAPPSPAGTRAAALKQQQRAERSLHDELLRLALLAESGPFARLLGSMAAAISQHLQARPLLGAT